LRSEGKQGRSGRRFPDQAACEGQRLRIDHVEGEDGIVECPDEYGDILGADKLEELLHEGSRHESQGKLPLEKYLIEKLKHRIGDSGFPDDVSILSISRGYNSGRSGSGSHDPCG
jgi:hypothetical protein